MPPEAATPAALPPSGRVPILDAVRGLAALSVCLYHFTYGNPDPNPDPWITTVGSFGRHGVDAFFVVSGFVIPFALEQGGYRLRDFWRFLAKRVIRIDPPLFLSMAVALAVWWAATHAPGYHGIPFALDWAQIALHAGYLTAIAGKKWVLSVYWTLAIEFQFYLSIALLYPLLRRGSPLVFWSIIVASAALTLTMHDIKYLPTYGAWFAVGIVTWQHYQQRVARAPFLATLAVCSALIWFAEAPAAAIAVAATSLAIVTLKGSHPALDWLGARSYSLYLIHVPIAGRVVNLATRLPWHGFWIAIVVTGVATAVALTAATIFYHVVERPSKRLAARIRYRAVSATALPPMAPAVSPAAAPTG
jgi:peptidoglycan/LPS O-acetylase OafA/YrhL